MSEVFIKGKTSEKFDIFFLYDLNPYSVLVGNFKSLSLNSLPVFTGTRRDNDRECAVPIHENKKCSGHQAWQKKRKKNNADIITQLQQRLHSANVCLLLLSSFAFLIGKLRDS